MRRLLTTWLIATLISSSAPRAILAQRTTDAAMNTVADEAKGVLQDLKAHQTFRPAHLRSLALQMRLLGKYGETHGWDETYREPTKEYAVGTVEAAVTTSIQKRGMTKVLAEIARVADRQAEILERYRGDVRAIHVQDSPCDYGAPDWDDWFCNGGGGSSWDPCPTLQAAAAVLQMIAIYTCAPDPAEPACAIATLAYAAAEMARLASGC